MSGQTPQENPVPAQETPDSVLDSSLEAFRDLKEAVANKTSPEDIQKGLDALNATTEKTIRTVKEAASNAMDSAKMEALQKEINDLPATLKALPAELQKNAEELSVKTKTLSGTIYEKLKSGAGTAWHTVADGVGWSFEKVGNAAAKIGEFVNRIWEGMKPHMGKIAAMPGLSFIIGSENAKYLQEWFGYDPAMTEIRDAVRNRIPQGIAFDMTEKRELIAFTDRYQEMLRIRKVTPDQYSKGSFVDEMLRKNLLKPNDAPADASGVKRLTMEQIVTAAKELIEKTETEQKANPAPVNTPNPAA